LEASEQKYFRNYVTGLMNADQNKLSYFELNLETWRQLWRVIEMSDILLVIVDIRSMQFFEIRVVVFIPPLSPIQRTYNRVCLTDGAARIFTAIFLFYSSSK